MGPSDESLAMADALLAALPAILIDRYTLAYAIMGYWESHS